MTLSHNQHNPVLSTKTAYFAPPGPSLGEAVNQLLDPANREVRGIHPERQGDYTMDRATNSEGRPNRWRGDLHNVIGEGLHTGNLDRNWLEGLVKRIHRQAGFGANQMLIEKIR